MGDWKLLKQGAESKIYLAKHMDKEVIVKERFPKLYRINHLDNMINKQRTRAEVKILTKLSNAGIKVPQVYKVETKQNTIYMEYIQESVTLKELLIDMEASKNYEAITKLAQSLGDLVAKLHVNGVIHGDLTTSNFLYQGSPLDILNSPSIELYTIDFGLSHAFNIAHSKINCNSILEEKAVDLYVLERAFISTHPSLEYYLHEYVIKSYAIANDSYAQENSSNMSQPILKKLEEVRMRGRKRTMVG